MAVGTNMSYGPVEKFSYAMVIVLRNIQAMLMFVNIEIFRSGDLCPVQAKFFKYFEVLYYLVMKYSN